MPPALTQAMALLAVGAIGMLALSVTTAGERLSADGGRLHLADVSRPVTSAPPHVRADVVAGEGQALEAEATAHRAAPVRRAAAPARHPSASHPAKKIVKWLPTGTGMWIYQWDHSNGGRAAAVVKRAK